MTQTILSGLSPSMEAMLTQWCKDITNDAIESCAKLADGLLAQGQVSSGKIIRALKKAGEQ